MENSVLVHSGFKEHAMLCEFMKIKLDDSNSLDPNKAKINLAILVYNSGDGINYHFQRQEGASPRFSPVMIFVLDWDKIFSEGSKDEDKKFFTELVEVSFHAERL